MWKTSSTKSIGIYMDSCQILCRAWEESRFMSPRAWALLNKIGFSFVCLIRSLWMRVGTSGQSWWFGWTSVRSQSSRFPDRDSSICSFIWTSIFKFSVILFFPTSWSSMNAPNSALSETYLDSLQWGFKWWINHGRTSPLTDMILWVLPCAQVETQNL